MGSRFIQFNNHNWKIDLLGEKVYLLSTKDLGANEVRKESILLEKILEENLTDITVGYNSIALFTPLDYMDLKEALTITEVSHSVKAEVLTPLEIPICYEMGPDLSELAKNIKISPEHLIELHLQGQYEVAMIGFLPGFIYAEGLNPKIHYPRKSKPTKDVLAGSVGIGGSQTGIYSFNSPGGWHIIGRTPLSLFSLDKVPPTLAPVGHSFQFYRISKEEFLRWEN